MSESTATLPEGNVSAPAPSEPTVPALSDAEISAALGEKLPEGAEPNEEVPPEGQEPKTPAEPAGPARGTDEYNQALQDKVDAGEALTSEQSKDLAEWQRRQDQSRKDREAADNQAREQARERQAKIDKSWEDLPKALGSIFIGEIQSAVREKRSISETNLNIGLNNYIAQNRDILTQAIESPYYDLIGGALEHYGASMDGAHEQHPATWWMIEAFQRIYEAGRKAGPNPAEVAREQRRTADNAKAQAPVAGAQPASGRPAEGRAFATEFALNQAYGRGEVSDEVYERETLRLTGKPLIR